MSDQSEAIAPPASKGNKFKNLRVRLDRDEMFGFQQSAKLSGLTLSQWVRTQLRQAAEQRLSIAGFQAPWT